MELSNYFDAMNRAKKEYVRCLEPVCRQYQLTQNELTVLLFLHNNPGLDRAADIVSCRGIAKSHVSLAVSNLEARGILARCLAPADRRACHLALTKKGMEIADAGAERQRQFFEALYTGVTPEERELMRSITQKIMDNVASFA
ncbi:MAG: MarR family transcriptional regulator [Eubacteriales bacterium]|nr:MarR family transcriptional regulator [Eubacteriales bacterium]